LNILKEDGSIQKYQLFIIIQLYLQFKLSRKMPWLQAAKKKLVFGTLEKDKNYSKLNSSI